MKFEIFLEYFLAQAAHIYVVQVQS